MQLEYSYGIETRTYALGTAIPRDEWLCVAVTFDAGAIGLYLNGFLQQSFAGDLPSIRSSNQPLYIGARYISPIVGTFNGSIDDVSIHNRTLSPDEISASSCVIPVCGDGVVSAGEQCDGSAGPCPGLCLASCRCTTGEVPVVSEWGLVATTLLRLTVGTIVFARRNRRSVAH